MKKKSLIVTLLLVVGLFSITIGVTFAFFNYTRTGTENTLSVGRINFNHTQDGKIELSNIFPTSSSNLNNTNSDTVTINITGDTTYSGGIEYKVTLEDVNNTINGKEIPISFNVTASNLGTKSNDYWNQRGSTTNVYNLEETGEVEDGKYVLVGYIKPDASGVNGSIDITAYVDTDKIAISDTVSKIVNNEFVYGETTGEWLDGRIAITTDEWNSFSSSPLSFKVRVEANEGIWVEEEKQYVMKTTRSYSNWTSIRANITSIEFHKDGIAPENYIDSFNVEDITSAGEINLYTVDDGLGTNTYKAIVVADDTIYAPEDSMGQFSGMSKLKTFNSENYKVDNVINMGMMFALNPQLTNVSSLLDWNTSNVTSMINLFYGDTNLTDVNGLVNWNTSNVTNMSFIFFNCSSLININGLANWDTSNVTNMSTMFGDCYDLTDISTLSNWNTGKVENMRFMFGLSPGKTKVNDAIIDFSSLSNWNVSKVENMQSMFQNVNVKSYLPFENWNVSRVQDFSYMFNATPSSSITTLSGLENWDVSSAVYMSNMFFENVSLTDASAINNWNIKSSIDFTGMFGHDSVHPEFTKVTGTWDENGTFTPNA